jgi:hypothetical protein
MHPLLVVQQILKLLIKFGRLAEQEHGGRDLPSQPPEQRVPGSQDEQVQKDHEAFRVKLEARRRSR